MKIFDKKIMFWAAMILLFFSCSDLDSEENITNFDSLQEGYQAWGFVTAIGKDCYVTTDDKKILKLEGFDNSIVKVKEGDRVFLRFSINNESSDKLIAGTYTHSALVVDLQVVPYDTITNITREEKATLPNGLLKVQGIGISSHNLNLTIDYNKIENGDNQFKLFYDEELQEEGSPVTLQLVDVSSSDKTAKKETMERRLQSFDISKLAELGMENNSGKINFAIVVNKGTYLQENYSLIYEP